MDTNTMKQWLDGKMIEINAEIEKIKGKSEQTAAEKEMLAAYQEKKADFEHRMAEIHPDKWESFKLEASSWVDSAKSKINGMMSNNNNK